MKQYDPESKKYLDEEVITQKVAKRKLCKGKREHDYVLVLPDHVTYNEDYKFNPELYYKIMEEKREFALKQEQKLSKAGIFPKYGHSFFVESKTYMCTVCKKQDWRR